MKRALLCAVATCVVTACLCQGRWVWEDVYNHIDTARGGEVLLRVANENFFKNDEYFGDYVEGYTLVGYMVQPSVVYYATDDVMIEAGVRLLEYGGQSRYDDVSPVWKVAWRFNPHFVLTMGCIPSGVEHDLSEAMWDEEYQLTAEPEIGAHLRGEGEWLSGEVWIDWQQFIKRYDTIPEKFTAGVSLDVHPSAVTSSWQYEMPVRLIVSHIGGQISDYEERLQSLLNASVEARLRRVYGETSFVREWRLAMRGLLFYAMAGADVRPFSSGAAFNPEASLRARWFDVGLQYFAARNYYAMYGNPLFMSLSNYKDDVYSVHRNMAIVEGNINWRAAGCARFTVGAKLYYDVDAAQAEYYYGFGIAVTPAWRLARNVFPLGR